MVKLEPQVSFRELNKRKRRVLTTALGKVGQQNLVTAIKNMEEERVRLKLDMRRRFGN
jgi:hypothetical protein